MGKIRGCRNICFFSGDVTRCGGTERVGIALANELARELAGECSVCFLSLVEQGDGLFFELDGSICHYFLGDRWIKPGPGYIPLIGKVRRFFKEHDIDVVIDIDMVLDVLSIPAARGLKTRVVSWDHFNFDYELEVPYRRLILRYSARRSDYVVTLTRDNREQYGRVLGRTENITTIYNPAPPYVGAGKVKEKLLVSVGNLVPEKGIEFIPEVGEMVLNAHPDWSWVLLGDGTGRQWLEEELGKRGLAGRIILRGRVENVDDYLSAASIYVMCSRREGLPMCLLEAKAHAVPIVSFDIKTGPSEIVEDAVNGILVKPYDCRAMADAINRLIADEGLRGQMSDMARQGLAAFDMKTITAEWIGVLRHICG
jgi:glycosyltransferase involved in cell wall biosynthesis